MKHLYNLQEAADAAQVHKRTIRRAIEAGKLPATKEGHGQRSRFEVRSDNLENWLDNRKR